MLASPEARATEQGRREYRKVCKLMANRKKEHWYLDRHNVRVVADWLIENAIDLAHARVIVGCCLAAPWKYRAEFVIATCERLDFHA